MTDLDTLRLHIPIGGFYTQFTCPNQVLVLGGNREFLTNVDAWNDDNTFCNMFVVQRSHQEQAIEVLCQHYDTLHGIRAQKHGQDDMGSAIMVWEQDNNDFVMIAVFSDLFSEETILGDEPPREVIEHYSLDANLIKGEGGAQVMFDSGDSGVKDILDAMGYISHDLYRPIAHLLQTMVDPKGLWHDLISDNQDLVAQWDDESIEDVLVLKYFIHCEQEHMEENISSELIQAMQSIIDERAIRQALEGHEGGAAGKKPRM